MPTRLLTIPTVLAFFALGLFLIGHGAQRLTGEQDSIWAAITLVALVVAGASFVITSLLAALRIVRSRGSRTQLAS